MARWAAYLKRERQQSREHHLALAGGDFFGPGGVDERPKGEAVLRAVHLMDFDAFTLGEMDFAYGLAPIREALEDPALVTTNLTWAGSGKLLGPPMRVLRFRGLPAAGESGRTFRVAVLALMDERLQPVVDGFLKGAARQVKVLPAQATLREWLPRARARADFVVVLAHLASTPASSLAEAVPGVQLIVAGHAMEEVIEPGLHVQSTWIVANGDRGRYVGEIGFRRDGAQWVRTGARQVFLDSKMTPEDTAMKQFVERSKLAMEIRRNALPSTDGEMPRWATLQTCMSCHQEQTTRWAGSPHAQAYHTLVSKNEQKREECLRCHVLGLGTAGGFNPADPKPNVMHVQCESCHGPGVRHSLAAAADRKKTIVGHPGERVCRSCHPPRGDPTFDYATAVARIKH